MKYDCHANHSYNQDVLAQCGLAGASHATLTIELSGLRRRAAEAHAQHDHVHELVLLKVALLLESSLPPPQQGGSSSINAVLPRRHIPQRPPTPGNCSNAEMPAPLPPRTAPMAEACPPERKPSLIRRQSCSSLSVLSPTATTDADAPQSVAKPAGDLVPACNAVMLRSVSSRSLSIAALASTAECALLAATDDADMDPSDIPALVQVCCVCLQVHGTPGAAV